VTRLFSKQSTLTIQAVVPSLSEACLERIHDSKKTLALLFGPPNYSGQWSTSVRHIEQPRRNRACLFVGNRNFPLDITYKIRKAVKSQILPDITAEWLELQNTGPPNLSRVWAMYFDRSKRVEGAGARVVLISPQGDKLKYVLWMSLLRASNNKANTRPSCMVRGWLKPAEQPATRSLAIQIW
jgi:hypothetical protein